jgi:hypothetical protein
VYLAPRIREQSAGRIDFSAQQLDRECGYPWDGEITTLPITGNFMTEIVFFHQRTRTLVLTDLIENFEPDRTSSKGFAGWQETRRQSAKIVKAHTRSRHSGSVCTGNHQRYDPSSVACERVVALTRAVPLARKERLAKEGAD